MYTPFKMAALLLKPHLLPKSQSPFYLTLTLATLLGIFKVDHKLGKSQIFMWSFVSVVLTFQ